MPVVAITLVCLLWLQPPESRIYSAYRAPPPFFQLLLPHGWIGKRVTRGEDQGSIEDGHHAAPGTDRTSLARTVIPLLRQDALTLVFCAPHTKYDLGKDITSQEKNLHRIHFSCTVFIFRVWIKPVWLKANISSFEIQIWCICHSVMPQRFNRWMFKIFLLVASSISHKRGLQRFVKGVVIPKVGTFCSQEQRGFRRQQLHSCALEISL